MAQLSLKCFKFGTGSYFKALRCPSSVFSGHQNKSVAQTVVVLVVYYIILIYFFWIIIYHDVVFLGELVSCLVYSIAVKFP